MFTVELVSWPLLQHGAWPFGVTHADLERDPSSPYWRFQDSDKLWHSLENLLPKKVFLVQDLAKKVNVSIKFCFIGLSKRISLKWCYIVCITFRFTCNYFWLNYLLPTETDLNVKFFPVNVTLCNGSSPSLCMVKRIVDDHINWGLGALQNLMSIWMVIFRHWICPIFGNVVEYCCGGNYVNSMIQMHSDVVDERESSFELTKDILSHFSPCLKIVSCFRPLVFIHDIVDKNKNKTWLCCYKSNNHSTQTLCRMCQIFTDFKIQYTRIYDWILI